MRRRYIWTLNVFYKWFLHAKMIVLEFKIKQNTCLSTWRNGFQFFHISIIFYFYRMKLFDDTIDSPVRQDTTDVNDSEILQVITPYRKFTDSNMTADFSVSINISCFPKMQWTVMRNQSPFSNVDLIFIKHKFKVNPM